MNHKVFIGKKIIDCNTNGWYKYAVFASQGVQPRCQLSTVLCWKGGLRIVPAKIYCWIYYILTINRWLEIIRWMKSDLNSMNWNYFLVLSKVQICYNWVYNEIREHGLWWKKNVLSSLIHLNVQLAIENSQVETSLNSATFVWARFKSLVF